MAIRFNADEVFAMAEKMEDNGAKFYRRAAELHKKESGVLLKLATMEDQHKTVFAGMRSKLAAAAKAETAFDPYMEAELYLHAMTDSQDAEGSPRAAGRLTGKESLADILRTAIGLEEKSIVFYLGLKDIVPASLGKDHVEAIIAEEKSHVAALAAELKKL